jgi:glycosyltransferase involved in cell wall biosynthesis
MRYLKRSKPDFLISEAHYSNEAAMLAKLLSGAPTKIVVAEQIMLSLHAKQGQHASARLATLTSRIFYRFADAIVASSHGVAKDSAQITGLPLERIKVIYNPVITPRLLDMSKEPVDHPWFAPGAPPVILSAGRLDSQKDFPTLIRAFARVRKARYARLVILGKGDEHHSLKTLIKELELEKDIALPGYLQNPFAYMSKAAVFVLSSIYEGLPNVLIEAMAAGTPVVSTDCPSGPAEILSNGKYGELIPVGDSEKMAAAIMRALDEKRKAIDPAWLGQFTVEVAAQKYIDLLMDCRKGVK